MSLDRLKANESGVTEDQKAGKARIRDWIIVSGIAVVFVIYGFMAYFVIGDKGPPDWDFGIVPDVPGEDIYSSYPTGTRIPEELAPQHVSEKPPAAVVDISPEKGMR